MKWFPSDCRPGDMVRIRTGSVWHYGVVTGEDRVIQFGLPSLLAGDHGDIVVCATDMETFCCGQIVEVAQLDKTEAKKRIPPKETVRLAESRLGEGGYNLIHNNCEHFAFQCVMGTKLSMQEEEARKRWNSRPICDVYVAKIPEQPMAEPVLSPERRRYLQKTHNPQLLAQQHFAWKLLEEAAQRSFSKKPEELSFRRSPLGFWTAEGFRLSLSHTRDFVAVAVSNYPVGVDVEHVEDFLSKFPAESRAFLAAAKKITAAGERCETPMDLLDLWTRKESAFKALCKGRFLPHKLTLEHTVACRLPAELPLYLALCSQKADRARYYYYENGAFRLMPVDREKMGLK